MVLGVGSCCDGPVLVAFYTFGLAVGGSCQTSYVCCKWQSQRNGRAREVEPPSGSQKIMSEFQILHIEPFTLFDFFSLFWLPLNE